MVEKVWEGGPLDGRQGRLGGLFADQDVGIRQEVWRFGVKDYRRWFAMN